MKEKSTVQMKKHSTKKRKRKKQYNMQMLSGLFFPLLFALITIWTPFYDPFYTYITIGTYVLYTGMLIAVVGFRLEKYYSLMGYTAFILTGCYCLFTGLKGAQGFSVLQCILLFQVTIVFIFGFWAEKIIPQLQEKDWFTAYSLTLIFGVMPAIYIVDVFGSGMLRHYPGLIHLVFGQESGNRIVAYLIGYSFPVLFIYISQFLYWKVQKDEK